MSSGAANQLLMFGTQALITIILLLGLFRMRSRLGLSPLYVTLGVFQPIQVLLASSIYVEIRPDLLISPGSTVMFTASLFAILVVYIFEDAIEARKVIYGIMVANLVMTLLMLAFGAQLNLPGTLNFLGLPQEIFNQGGRVMFVGTMALFADVLLIIFVFEGISRLIPKFPFFRIFLTMAIIVTFDTLVFATGVFGGQSNYDTIVMSGIVGKVSIAGFYSVVLFLYLRFIEPVKESVETYALNGLKPFQDIFYALSYRERYMVQKDYAEKAIHRSEAKLMQRSQELAALNKMSTRISQSLSVEKIISQALSGLLQTTEANAVFLLMKKGEDLIPAGIVFSEPGRAFTEFPTHKLGQCLCGMAASEKKSIFSPNIYTDPRCTWEECKQAGLHSAAALPLFSGNEVIAILGLGTDNVNDFEKQAEYLEALASAIALGLQNALLFEQIQKNALKLEKEVKRRTLELEDSQKALIYLLEDVSEARDQLETANHRLKELDQLKSMFIASMSHELRTPLNSIIGFTGILLQGLAGDLNTEQQDQLGRVSRAGKHLLSLITDVIDVSKIEAGKVDLYLESFELGALINEAITAVKVEAGLKGLSLVVDIHKSIFMRTDRRRLLQCVMNLLSNSVKYSEKGGISVTALNMDQHIEIQVSDTGIGIAESDLPLLFSSFARLESHLKIKTPGTGLGLYLTRKIITDLLGGKISVKSKLGKGSTFSIKLPIGIVRSHEPHEKAGFDT